MTRGRGGEDQAAEDLKAFGLDDGSVREALGEAEPEACAVWQDNAETVEMFMALQTQWRIGPMGGYLGLDYPGVAALLGLKVRKAADRRNLFDGIRVMECAALPVLNSRHD